MARPDATVIISADKYAYGEDDTVIEILECKGIWILSYDGKPISMREKFWATSGQRVRYPRVSHAHRAHAVNLAMKLNRQFKSNKFGVIKIA